MPNPSFSAATAHPSERKGNSRHGHYSRQKASQRPANARWARYSSSTEETSAKISDPGKDITSFHNDLAALNRGGRTRVGGATRRAGSRKKGSGCPNPSRAVERANFLGRAAAKCAPRTLPRL